MYMFLGTSWFVLLRLSSVKSKHKSHKMILVMIEIKELLVNLFRIYSFSYIYIYITVKSVSLERR